MKRLHTYDQHFLRSPKIVAELIGHTNIRKNDVVYDLGAGSGVITSVLRRRCGTVVAVENEPAALEVFHQHNDQYGNVTVIEGDILDVMPPSGPYKIFSNIPFSMSAKIVRKFTESEHPPKSIYLITQKQFAQKLAQSDRHFTSQLGAQLGASFVARIRRPLRKTDFTPPPAVDTVLLEIKLREEPLLSMKELPHYRDFVERCYAEQKYFQKIFQKTTGNLPEQKPSEQTIEQWVSLFVSSK